MHTMVEAKAVFTLKARCADYSDYLQVSGSECETRLSSSLALKSLGMLHSRFCPSVRIWICGIAS